MSFLILAVFVLVIGASLAFWSAGFARLRNGQSLLDWESHPSVPWGFADVIVAALAFVMPQVIAGELLRQIYGIQAIEHRSTDDYLRVLVATALSLVATTCIAWLWLRLRGASRSDLGVDNRHLARDIATGVMAFVMLAPIVFGLQMALVLIVGPTKHPFILLLQKTPDVRLFLATSANAVLLAPVVEELLFRGVLQGWFESLRRGMMLEEILFGRANAPPSAQAIAYSEKEQNNTDNPYSPPVAIEPPVTAEIIDAPRAAARQSWLPVLASSILFSLAHVSHGPDFVPLFVLALGLGYLYRQTHRLLPCMVVHFLLNATSMGLLYVQLFAKG